MRARLTFAGDAATAFDSLWIWSDAAHARRLAWHREAATNRMTAKFRIAATVPAELDLGAASEDVLWAELDRLTPISLSLGSRPSAAASGSGHGLRDRACSSCAASWSGAC